jgi:hypothetical protein
MRRLAGTIKPCQSCTVSILRTFTALNVSTISPSRLSSQYKTFPSTASTRASVRRYIHSDVGNVVTENTRPVHEDGKVVEEVNEEETAEIPEDPDPSSTTFLPWYLRDENLQQPLRNAFNRRELPPLPADPPTVIQPLMYHIYEDLGIDDLVLHDLRNVQPAPALGSNLLMIIGTARSEKHLHISADRLCRWLRTNYKLKPFADGLLGRNELKIKLRRKARRAKLMSNAGGRESENVDDGIRTGWVCVNIGRVDSEKVENVEERPADFIGFGRRSEGTQIVVQMLTEAKREEVDLEGLWAPIAEQSEKKESNASKGDSADEVSRNVPRSTVTGNTSSTESGMNTSRSFGTGSITRVQTRALHTVPPRPGSHLLARIHGNFDGWETVAMDQLGPGNDLENPTLRSKAPAKTDSKILEAIGNGDYKYVRRTLLEPGKKLELDLTDDDSKSLMLRALLAHLRVLPEAQALQALGTGSEDFASTQFLLSFHQTLPPFASDDHWHARLAMICHARQLGHPGYKGSAAAKIIRQMQLSAVPITEEAYFLALETILGPWTNTNTNQKLRLAEGYVLETPEERLDAVLTVLETMSYQHPELISEQTIVRLVKSIPVSERQVQSSPSPTIPGCSAIPEDLEQRRIIDLMRLYGAKVMKDTTWFELFFLYSERKQWTAFWDLWYQRARLGRRRSSEYYSMMFALIAISGHQAACMDVLRTWVPAMAYENPPVKPDDATKRAVRECILTADPDVPRKLERDPACNDEWVVAWRKTLSR